MGKIELSGVEARLQSAPRELLLLALRDNATKQLVRRDGGPCRPDGLESALLDLAKRNCVTSLALDVLRNARVAEYTASAGDELTGLNSWEHARRKLGMRSELLRVLRAFEAVDLDVIPLKGPVLADFVYSNPHHRDYGDLDLLVRPAEFDRARQILENLGYYCPFRNEDLQRRYHVILHHAERDVLVELHWRIANEHYPVFRSGDFLWDGARVAHYYGTKLIVPSAEANLVYLAIHAFKHSWGRLQWIKDIEQVVANSKDFSIQRAVDISRSVSAERILAATIQVAAYIFPASAELRNMLEVAGTTLKAKELDAIVSELFEKSDSGHGISRQFVTRLGLLRTNRERFNVLVPYLKVSDADRAFLRLPKSLSFLYFLIKPFRIAFRVGPFATKRF